MHTRYIYLSGLGDGLDYFRRFMLWTQRLRGRDVVLVPMKWSDTRETDEHKLNRLMNTLASMRDCEIVLVGESAGAAMALRALIHAPDKVTRIVTVCGYLHTASGIDDIHRTVHPAFVQIVEANDRHKSHMNMLRPRITNLYALKDMVIKPRYATVEGAQFTTLPGRNHQGIIMMTVLFRAHLWQ